MINSWQKNIDNLASLWKTAGMPFQTYIQFENFELCRIPNSAWPNRIWFHKAVTEDMLKAVVEIIRNTSAPLSISHWSGFDNKLHVMFEQFGFIKKSEQIGMSLRLQQKFRHLNRIHLQRITKEKQAEDWSALYPLSFGYKISVETLLKTQHQIQYYLVCLDRQIVGTVIAHETENVIGIHGLGIAPEFRKRGLAEAVMKLVLNQAIDNNIEYATLQSSPLGRNIYLRMGFTEDFLMTNYQLTHQIK